MRIFLIVALLGFCSEINAQKYFDDFEIGYRHTLTYPEYKVVFQAQQTNQIVKVIAPEKTYWWFSNNQIQTTQGGYSGKLLHGEYTVFYANKNLKEQGHFIMGLKDGLWKNWNESGVLVSQYTFKAGIANGDYFVYDAKGKLIELGKNKNGKIDGEQQRYIADSVVKVKYKNGIPLTNKDWLKRLFVKNRHTKPSI